MVDIDIIYRKLAGAVVGARAEIVLIFFGAVSEGQMAWMA